MKIEFSKKAEKQFSHLNPRLQNKIIESLEKFKIGEKIDIKKLKGFNETYRIRVGSYRISLDKTNEDTFLITYIAKRENFYLI